MALTISDTGGGSFEQAPQGNHNATCYRLVDVGTHNETFEGETKKGTAYLFHGNLTMPRWKTADPLQY